MKKLPLINGFKAFPWKNLIVASVFLALPFLVLYWLVPFAGKYTIGNDYLGYWINMQLYMHFSIENGTFPLYAPGFNCGWTASTLTLGQLHHPVSWIAASIPGYWNGHAHEIGTLLRLLSLGTCHLLLYVLLRRFRLGIALAFVISFVTTYNLKMLDMFRYGASLENYTAFLLLCVMILWCYITPKKRLARVCIAVSTFLLVVGGHPQIMFLGLLGAAIVCLIAPFYMTLMLPEQASLTLRRVRGFYLTVGGWMFIGIFLASLYIMPFYFEYIQESVRNLNMGFLWACDYQDTLGGSLCNFFNPFHSGVCGAFGGSALIIIAAIIPVLFFLKIRLPWVILTLWLISVAVFVMMIGSNGPLYYYFWKYFPFAQSFRVPGRVGLMLPFLMLLLLAWVARCKPFIFQIRGRNISLSPIAVAATAGLLLFVILNSFSLEVFNLDEGYVPVNLHQVPEIAITIFIAMGVLSLVALVVSTIKSRIRLLGDVVLILAVVFQTGLMLRYGTWIAPAPRKTITLERMRVQQQEQVGFRENSGEWSRLEVNRHLSQTFIEPLLARICRKYTVVDSIEKAYRNMSAGRAIDHVFIENYTGTDNRTPPKTLDREDIDRINLNYNSFNNLRFDVTSSKPGFFVLSLPSNRWKAYINGQNVTVYRANAIERAIWLEAGNNNVEFRYWSPAAVIGTVISCAILFFLAQYLIASAPSKLFRRSAIFIVLCICISVFIIWYHSLYWGGHIGTNYNWTSKDIQPHLSSTHNLAYGKKAYTGMRVHRQYLYAASRGTDGDRRPAHGFATNQARNAWWQLDLGKVETIEEIVLYKHRNKSILPFDIVASPDGKRGFLIKTITEYSPQDYWHIKCPKVRARYIRIQARKNGQLFLSEVEVYGPKYSFEETNLKGQ